jgi:hypothetical protein
MWESIKNLVTGAKDALGIELPELPVEDLGAAGEAATNVAQPLTDSAGGLVEGAATAGQTLTGDLPGAAEAVTGLPAAAADSAAQVLPDLPNDMPKINRT